MLLLIKVCYFLNTLIFRKTKMSANRAMSLVASPIIFTKKYDFFAMEQHVFAKLHYSFRER